MKNTWEFRVKNRKEIKNYFIKEIEQNELSNKHKKFCAILNYIESFLILAFGCIFISDFA